MQKIKPKIKRQKLRPLIAVHRNSGVEYKVTDVSGKLKFGGVWYSSISYKDDSGKTYTRTRDDFLEKFNLIDD